MHPQKALICADFDLIARCNEPVWDHNQHYHKFLEKQIPGSCARILEIGCGTEKLARKLALHAEQVLALDLSPEMVRIARDSSCDFSHIEFRVADAETIELPAAGFDCIVSAATLHHLPLKEMLIKLKALLKPGGVLVVLDLYKAATISDLLISLFAIPVNWFLTLIKTGLNPGSKEIEQAYKKHSGHDDLLPFSLIRNIGSTVLPGSRVRRHLLWRYSIVYNRERKL